MLLDKLSVLSHSSEFSTDRQIAKPPTATNPATKATVTSRPPAASSAAGPSRPTAKAASGKVLTISPSEPVKYRYNAEDAAALATQHIPEAYHTQLADPAWKVRLESAEELTKWVEEESGFQKVDSEVMFRFLGKTPGWNEKNFQVGLSLVGIQS